MIKQLSIQNLVLVEQCSIEFGKHLNIITGETGSGKTAFTAGIALCLGSRASVDLIRKGCDKAVVEMTLGFESGSSVQAILQDAGLDEEEELVLRREISREGKSRAWLNCKQIPLPLLQEIGSVLVDQISQHSHLQMRSFEAQRNLLDLFANLTEELNAFQKSYSLCRQSEKRIADLNLSLEGKEKQEELFQFQLEEISSAQLKEGEEETLFARYKQLSTASERISSVHSLLQISQEGPSSLLSQLHKLIRLTQPLTASDPQFNETLQLWQEALIPLQEGIRTLQSYSEEDLADPRALAALEERLSLLQKLKRKYALNLPELLSFQNELQEKLNRFATLGADLEEEKKLYEQRQKETDLLAKKLSQKRKQAAIDFATLLTKELEQLNMNKAVVTIELVPCLRTGMGDEEVRFWLQANPGELPALVKEHGSGGEICRLLFVIKVALAAKNQTETLIFDEIDAHVGGKTATLMGKQLQSLGSHKQVLCITHFPQVASYADVHIQVQKTETADGRTVTQIQRLSSHEEKQQELARMSGN